jgi:hypothetical protein
MGCLSSVTANVLVGDPCGNEAADSATFTIKDTTAPAFDPLPADDTVECNFIANQIDKTRFLNHHGGSVAVDACSLPVDWKPTIVSLWVDNCPREYRHQFSIADQCDNMAVATATLTIADTSPPYFLTPAEDLKLQCEPATNTIDIDQYIARKGGSTADDECRWESGDGNAIGAAPLTWQMPNTPILKGGCIQKLSLIFGVADECDNHAQSLGSIDIVDASPPVLTGQPKDITIACDAATTNSKIQEWLDSGGGTTAYDDCNNDVHYTYSYHGLTSPKCGESATLTFTASDKCGNTVVTAPATINVVDEDPPVMGVRPNDKMSEASADLDLSDKALKRWLSGGHGAECTDACDKNVVVEDSNPAFSFIVTGAQESFAVCQDKTATSTFTCMDECQNAVVDTATFTVKDTQPPSILGAGSDLLHYCDERCYLTQSKENSDAKTLFTKWVDEQHGCMTIEDANTVSWSYEVTSTSVGYFDINNLCGSEGVVAFIAVDACGNLATRTLRYNFPNVQSLPPAPPPNITPPPMHTPPPPRSLSLNTLSSTTRTSTTTTQTKSDPPPCVPTTACVICDSNNKNKPSSLTIRYTSSGASYHNQGSKAYGQLSGTFPLTTTVSVGSFSQAVTDGQVFTVPGSFSADSTFSLSNGATTNFHTSCSVELKVGDRFGPYTIVGGGSNCPAQNACPPSPTAPPPQASAALCTICDKSNKNKPASLTFKYVSAAKSAHSQGSKAFGQMAGMYPGTTTITVRDQMFVVADGESFTIDQISTNIHFQFGDAGGSYVQIHGSCSVPLQTGDQFGPLILESGGGCARRRRANFEVVMARPRRTTCTICDSGNKNKPSSLTFRYTSATANVNQQGNKAYGQLTGDYPSTNTVTAFGHHGGSIFSAAVTDGSSFTVSDSFGAETTFVFGSGGSVTFHTSCSVPLQVGDRFGPLEVMGGGSCVAGSQDSSLPDVFGPGCCFSYFNNEATNTITYYDYEDGYSLTCAIGVSADQNHGRTYADGTDCNSIKSTHAWPPSESEASDPDPTWGQGCCYTYQITNSHSTSLITYLSYNTQYYQTCEQSDVQVSQSTSTGQRFKFDSDCTDLQTDHASVMAATPAPLPLPDSCSASVDAVNVCVAGTEPGTITSTTTIPPTTQGVVPVGTNTYAPTSTASGCCFTAIFETFPNGASTFAATTYGAYAERLRSACPESLATTGGVMFVDSVSCAALQSQHTNSATGCCHEVKTDVRTGQTIFYNHHSTNGYGCVMGNTGDQDKVYTPSTSCAVVQLQQKLTTGILGDRAGCCYRQTMPAYTFDNFVDTTAGQCPVTQVQGALITTIFAPDTTCFALKIYSSIAVNSDSDEAATVSTTPGGCTVNVCAALAEVAGDKIRALRFQFIEDNQYVFNTHQEGWKGFQKGVYEGPSPALIKIQSRGLMFKGWVSEKQIVEVNSMTLGKAALGQTVVMVVGKGKTKTKTKIGINCKKFRDLHVGDTFGVLKLVGYTFKKGRTCDFGLETHRMATNSKLKMETNKITDETAAAAFTATGGDTSNSGSKSGMSAVFSVVVVLVICVGVIFTVSGAVYYARVRGVRESESSAPQIADVVQEGHNPMEWDTGAQPDSPRSVTDDAAVIE